MLRNRVKEFRELHGLTQEELADRTLITRQVIARMEAEPGYLPMMSTALRLCLYFKVDIGRLFWVDWASVAASSGAPVIPDEIPA